MASKKTYAELKAYFETGDKPTQAQFEDMLYTFFDGISERPKVYKALISQSSTSAPSVVSTDSSDVTNPLVNTLGSSPVFSYVAPGVYDVTHSSFAEGKTIALLYGLSNVDTTHTIYRFDVDKFRICTNFGGSADNGLLDNSTIIFEVYP